MRVLGVVIVLSAVAAIASVAFAAGGGPAAARVTVTLADGSLRPDRATVPAGRVTFDMRNAGRAEHELIVVRTKLAPDAIPLGLEGPNVALAGRVVLGTPHTHSAHEAAASLSGADRLGASRHVRPGESRHETVRLAAGSYVLLCSLPGHYQSGQRAGLTVTRG